MFGNKKKCCTFVPAFRFFQVGKQLQGNKKT